MSNERINRSEFFNKFSPCGFIKFKDLKFLIESLSFTDQDIKFLILDRLSKNGELTREDWILISKSVVYISEQLNGEIVSSWLNNKCKFSISELKIFLDRVEFTNSDPTYLLTQTNDLLILE